MYRPNRFPLPKVNENTNNNSIVKKNSGNKESVKKNENNKKKVIGILKTTMTKDNQEKKEEKIITVNFEAILDVEETTPIKQVAEVTTVTSEDSESENQDQILNVIDNETTGAIQTSTSEQVTCISETIRSSSSNTVVDSSTPVMEGIQIAFATPIEQITVVPVLGEQVLVTGYTFPTKLIFGTLTTLCVLGLIYSVVFFYKKRRKNQEAIEKSTTATSTSK